MSPAGGLPPEALDGLERASLRLLRGRLPELRWSVLDGRPEVEAEDGVAEAVPGPV